MSPGTQGILEAGTGHGTGSRYNPYSKTPADTLVLFPPNRGRVTTRRTARQQLFYLPLTTR